MDKNKEKKDEKKKEKSETVLKYKTPENRYVRKTFIQELRQNYKKMEQAKKLKLKLRAYNAQEPQTNSDVKQLVGDLVTHAAQLESFYLGLVSWGEGNPDSFSDEAAEYCAELIQKLKNCRRFSFNYFECGLFNQNVTGVSLETILNSVQCLDQERLEKLQLNFGRLGVEDYKSLLIIKKKHMLHLAETISKFKNLKKIKLNLRSWGYQNSEMDDQMVERLVQAILVNKETLNDVRVSLYMWGYENEKITSNSIISLCKLIREIPQLRTIKLNMRRFQYVTENDILRLFHEISLKKDIQRIGLSFQFWIDKEEKINDKKPSDNTQYAIQKGLFWMGLSEYKPFLNKNVWKCQNKDRKMEIIMTNPSYDSLQDYVELGNQVRKSRFIQLKALRKQFKNKIRKEILWDCFETVLYSDKFPILKERERSKSLEQIVQ